MGVCRDDLIAYHGNYFRHQELAQIKKAFPDLYHHVDGLLCIYRIHFRVHGRS